MTSPFKGAIQRAMTQATQGRGAPKGRFSGALSRVMSRATQRPVKTVMPTKGHGFRNAGPIKPSVTPIAEADAALAQTGEGLRKTIGRIATGRMVTAKKGGKIRRRYKEGGKVGSAMTALQKLAQQYKAALDMDDTEKAGRIKRQMERMKRGSTKEADEEAAAVGEEKAATFAEGGKVSKLRAAMTAVRAHKYRLRKVDGEFQIKPEETKWDDDTTYYTDDLDDAVSTAKAEREAMNRKAK